MVLAVGPVAPVGPVGPCGPVAPVSPFNPWLNIDMAVDVICQYAVILTRVRETATIMKAKLMVHM